MFSVASNVTRMPKTPPAPQRTDRRGSNTIFLAPDLSERLDTVRSKVGTESKAHLARLGLDFALSKLESGEFVILNGKLVPAATATATAA